MAQNSVLFKVGTWEQYSNLAVKDPNTLYWITDATHQELWKGDELFGRGSVATDALAGLMSADDKKALDRLVAAGGGADFPTYELELQTTPEPGAISTYKLKMTANGVSSYVGDAINIPKDRVLSDGSLAYVTADDVPYPGAKVGDPYLDLVLSDEAATHVYIPVKGLVDVPSAGLGINVVNNIVSIKLDSANAHGLKVTENGLALDLATETSDGAMSAEDKKTIVSLPEKYALKTDLEGVSGSVEWGTIE